MHKSTCYLRLLITVFFLPSALLWMPQAASFAQDAPAAVQGVPTLALARLGRPGFNTLSPVNDLLFSPTNRLLACATDSSVDLWDVATGALVRRLTGISSRPVTTLAFSPDGTMLAYATHVGGQVPFDNRNLAPAIRLWDTRSRKHTTELLGHTDSVVSACFSPDGTLLATSAHDCTLIVWNVATAKKIRTCHSPGGNVVTQLAFSTDGKELGGKSGGTVHFWNPSTGKQLEHSDASTPWKSRWIHQEKADLCILECASSAVQLKVGRTSPRLATSVDHGAPVYSYSFSPDCSMFASAGRDNIARLWNSETGKLLGEFGGDSGGMSAIAFSQDGDLLACGSANGLARVWNIRTRKELHPCVGHRERITAVCYTPIGDRIATGDANGLVCIWDTTSGRLISRVAKDQGFLKTVLFLQDADRLVSAGQKDTIECWRSSTKKTTWVGRGHGIWIHSMAICEDPRQIISGGQDGTVRLWDCDRGTEISRLETFTGRDAIHCVCLSADGGTCAAGGQSGIVYLWNRPTGRLICTLEGHTRRVTQLVASFNGNMIISASARGDGSIRMWDVRGDES
jgi:WD40 repeat protein